MRALMKWGVAMTTHFPTHMISMHTALPWLDIGSACSNVVLHTYRLVVALTKLHDTSIWNLNLALTWSSFAISFLSAFSCAEAVPLLLDKAENADCCLLHLLLDSKVEAACETAHLDDEKTSELQCLHSSCRRSCQ